MCWLRCGRDHSVAVERGPAVDTFEIPNQVFKVNTCLK